jgi:TolA-binding protein
MAHRAIAQDPSSRSNTQSDDQSSISDVKSEVSDQAKAKSVTKPDQSKAKSETKSEAKSEAKTKAPKIPTLDQLSETELDVQIDSTRADETSEVTEQTKRQLDGVWEDFKRRTRDFIQESHKHRKLQSQIFKILYDDQSRSIEQRYKRPIRGAVETEGTQRQESIERFRAFLETHPSHPQYTPDSLYRLGMLLLEDSDTDFVKRVEEYNRRIAKDPEVDIPFPQRDQRQVISVFTQLVKDWPRYRELDAALYARGYSYFEMGEEQLALRDFKAIVKRFPNSDYRTEVWNLIGELHFDFAELPQAIAAYSEVTKDKKSQYYAPAFYKLAWTYYRNDQFEEAVEAFKTLINYSDQLVAQGKKGFGLRDEAMQYLAISLNEDDWDDDGVTDLDAGIKRIKRYLSGRDKYQAELLARLVEIFFDNTKYEEAIQTALYLFKAHPFYRRNPEIHAKIITAFDRVAQPEKAFIERDRITNVYVKDGPWYTYNYRDQEAIDKARTLMKDALIQAASYHHNRAQDFRQRSSELADADTEVLLRRAHKSYAKAALAYQRYLDRYKKDKNTYEILYNYADALFYSKEYQRALNQYLVVRDSELGDSFRQDSASSAILAHTELVKLAISKGKLSPKPSLMESEPPQDEEASPQPEVSESSGELKEVKPEEIPDLVQDGLALRSDYLNLKMSDPDNPNLIATMIYKIGEIYVDYQHFKPARERLIEVIEKHNKSTVAVNAASLLIETYRREGKWKEMAQWAERISQLNLGDDIANKAKLWKVGALFKSAEQLQKQKKYKEAAVEYIKLVDQNPQNKYASRALYNGAVAFEQAKMFDSAMKTFERIYRQFPKSNFAEDALFRVAYNAQRFYNYDHAVETFVMLARRYPKGVNAAGATFNAARLLEQTQQYKAAAKAYLDYSKRFSDQENAAESFYSVARCYEKLGDWKNQIKIYELFIKRYGKDAKYHDRVIRAIADTAKIYEKRNKLRKTKRTLKLLIKEFDDRQLYSKRDLVDLPAEAGFKLIEPNYRSFKKMKIKGSRRRQGKIITKMKEEIARLSGAYGQLLKYKSLTWSIAVFYRLAIMRRIFAQNLYDLPIPDGLTEEEEDVYTSQIEEIAIPIEDEAIQRLETALKKAREFRISSQWTKKILAVLNLYKPTEYPTFKDEKRLETPSIISTSGFLLPVDAQENEPERSDAPDESGEEPKMVERQRELGKREPKMPSKDTSKKALETDQTRAGSASKPGEGDTDQSPQPEDVEPLEDIEEINE